MSKATLAVETLLQAGFHEVGCWEINSAGDLAHRIRLPHQSGVYAFAIDGMVQYVGLASKSLRQRLGFYRRPGASQRTNVRLNEIIRGHLHEGTIVQILIAHPPDRQWNGLILKGAEGLEAGLISDFRLPWNIRGAQLGLAKQPGAARGAEWHGGRLAAKILELVKRRPGMTELEIAKAVLGPTAVQQQVNAQCRSLIQTRQLERSGSGGRSDPFVYHVTLEGEGV